MIASVLFADGSGPDWQVGMCEIARNDASCGIPLRARLYVEVQY